MPAMAQKKREIALPGDLDKRDLSTVTALRTKRPIVALTFDDGPHPRNTPRLLDMLAKRQIKATFYLIGQNVARYPSLARRIAEEGHEIGNHSWSHPFMDRLGEASVKSQIDRTTYSIFEATGKAPVTFRPPYGAFTRRQRQLLFKRRKLPTVLWSVDPRDWKRPGARVVADRIIRGSRPGSIVLSHDIHRPTIEAMPYTMDVLRSKGYKFVSVSEMLGWPDWSTRKFKLG